MDYDKIRLPAQDYDVEYEDANGDPHCLQVRAKTAVEAERKGRKRLGEGIYISNVEPTD